MENPYQNKRSEKLLVVCKLLLIIYQEFQSYGETAQQTQGKERIEVERRIPKDIWKVERQDYKSISTCFFKEERKIQSRNKCIRICN